MHLKPITLWYFLAFGRHAKTRSTSARKGMQGIVDPTNICWITTSGHPDTYPSPYVYVNQALLSNLYCFYPVNCLVIVYSG